MGEHANSGVGDFTAAGAPREKMGKLCFATFFCSFLKISMFLHVIFFLYFLVFSRVFLFFFLAFSRFFLVFSRLFPKIGGGGAAAVKPPRQNVDGNKGDLANC